MIPDNLSSLNKNELINIIENLKAKADFGEDDPLPYQVDYSSLLASMSDCVLVIDKNGKLIYHNNALVEMYPDLKDMPLGDDFINYFPDFEKNRASLVFDMVFKNGFEVRNEMLKTHDASGNKVYFIITSSPLKDENNEVSGVVGIMKNITEKHQLEKELKRNTAVLEENAREYLRQAEELRNLKDLNDDIVRNAPEGIFVMDNAGIVISENHALKTILGRKPDESLVGTNLLVNDAFVAGGLADYYNKCLEEKKIIKLNQKNYLPMKKDREIVMNMTMVPLPDQNDNVEKIIVLVDDMTEQAKKIQRMHNMEKLSSLGTLASGVAVELKERINRILMDLNFIRGNLDEHSPALDYIDAVQKQVKKIKYISKELLSLSSTEENKKVSCDLNKIVCSLPVEKLTQRLLDDGIAVNFKTEGVIPFVKASPKQLEQVILQFLENAEEAMPEKGAITILLQQEKGDLGDYAVLTISDTGIGISEENIEKIFQPFFTTKGWQATGLGLMIVSAIVENLGGAIGVKSVPGEGTSFRIVFPGVIAENE